MNNANNLRALTSIFVGVAMTGDIRPLLAESGVVALLNDGHLTQCEIQHAETALRSACQAGTNNAVINAFSCLSYEWDREGLTGSRVMDQVAHWAHEAA